MTHLSNYKPSDADVRDACLSFRHDFGLMSEKDRQGLEFEAREWLIAWRKTLGDSY